MGTLNLENAHKRQIIISLLKTEYFVWILGIARARLIIENESFTLFTLTSQLT
jgi:hypothetical protein